VRSIAASRLGETPHWSIHPFAELTVPGLRPPQPQHMGAKPRAAPSLVLLRGVKAVAWPEKEWAGAGSFCCTHVSPGSTTGWQCAKALRMRNFPQRGKSRLPLRKDPRRQGESGNATGDGGTLATHSMDSKRGRPWGHPLVPILSVAPPAAPVERRGNNNGNRHGRRAGLAAIMGGLCQGCWLRG
jgi:hypothetical protein